jgi:uncharacterized protein
MAGMTVAYGLAFVAVLIGATAQAITGIGFSLICAPLFTLTLGATDGVRLANLLAIAVNVLTLRRELTDVSPAHVTLLLVPAAIAAPVTAQVIVGLDPGLSSVVSGALVLVAVLALAKGLRLERLTGRAGAMVAGAVSGAMNVAGGVGGPAAASYAVNANWSSRTTRPTLGAYFLGVNVISVAARGIPPASGTFFVAVTAVLLAGFALGALLARRLDHNVNDLIRPATLALAAAGAAAAVVNGAF